MATSYADVFQQLFDDYGEMLAGGKIWSYEAGTTTPLVTYQNLSGSTANTNPVVLDATGRPAVAIRVTNGTAYKFVVTDSDDNEIRTLDYIIIGEADGSSSDTYLVHMTYEGTPGAQGFMGGHLFNDSVVFPIDFSGSLGHVLTNPAAEYVISIRKNGIEVGTAPIDASGNYTFATSSHSTKTFDPGDRLTFNAPDGVDTAADFTMLLEGTVQ